ncbi:hypothetical protein GGQ62_000419 [Polymorphobacter fuscus]|uniref:PEPxxWA-CTERM sorting domain-containing protein n=1 Tax=Sandarakinorhabdus fusca TaxID=1439888 RepID=UPI0016ABF779|nr:PEPxxWA-CTERM sorting domain-containing protein [Polymorphobacter fuscus]NJC07421.1 hypothetical protein [Polymorphobacter fuscus]
MAAAGASSAAHAAGFVNGGFENGTASGWTQGGGYRGPYFNNQLTPALFTPGDGGVRSSVISAGYVDPRVGAALGSTVYSGNYGFRVEDTTTGGYASVIQQRVNNYTDANIFFAWKSVLLGAHGPNDAATMIITLSDLTSGAEIIRREYNAANGGGGVDSRFSQSGSNFYTANWQIEQLAIDASLVGHDFLLSVLAADCEPTAHWGYVYLDGFGAAPPPIGGVPEPSSWAMMIAGFGLVGGAMRRRANQPTRVTA